ncbi:MAG: hypothetical protein JWM88_2427 [Verrucomicrobia bacterium]|nr:hypothetical protein [Verrucomicrobiota bacterium]
MSRGNKPVGKGLWPVLILGPLLMASLLPAVSASGATARENSGAQAVASSSAAARAREVLRQVATHGESWKMIHAAEALVALGEGPAVRALFTANEAADRSDYRIGAWRVRARTAESPEERSRWIGKIEAVLLDPASPDRLDAIETLSKLNCVISGPTLAASRQLAAGLSESDGTFPLWALALANEPGALERLAGVLTSANSQARGRAAYALRWLRPSSPQVLRALAQAADAEAADTDALPYMLGAALALNADPLRAGAWQARLEKILAAGETSARYEACQTLMVRYGIADLPRFQPLLEDPESDTRVGAAWSVLFIEARSRDHPAARGRSAQRSIRGFIEPKNERRTSNAQLPTSNAIVAASVSAWAFEHRRSSRSRSEAPIVADRMS